MNEDRGVSVLLPTYAGDNAEHLDTAIRSIVEQTRPPDELVLVRDGPITQELNSIIDTWRSDNRVSVTLVNLTENHGLPVALRVGIKHCSHELVARMDSDDISTPKRIQTQLEYLDKNPDTDVVGGFIGEFNSVPDEVNSRREVPVTHSEITQMARFRSPMNHGTVMFDKHAVLEAGNYRAVNRMEDYDLWIRMILNGSSFANIPQILVKVRAGDNLYRRRGGLEYAREEVRTQYEFYQRGFTTAPTFVFNMITRTSLRLLPSQARKWIYSSFARD